jgi:hypothetical protein
MIVHKETQDYQLLILISVMRIYIFMFIELDSDISIRVYHHPSEGRIHAHCPVVMQHKAR